MIRVSALGVVVALSALALPSTNANAEASGPSGDPQAIALNQQVQQTYSTLPGVKVVRRGALFARRTRRSGYEYLFTRRRGYRAATETAYFALSNGKFTGYLENVVAHRVGRFSILVNRMAAFTSYEELGGDYFTRRVDTEHLTRRLVRQLERLGQTVTLTPSTAEPG